MINLFLGSIRKKRFNNQFMKKNKNYQICAVNTFPLEAVSVGKYTYGGIGVLCFGSNSKLLIGGF